MENTELKSDWRLTNMKIEFCNWGENKGKYEGKITFENGDSESFTFKIQPEMANEFIQLMSKNIVKSASELGEKLIKSLGL